MLGQACHAGHIYGIIQHGVIFNGFANQLLVVVQQFWYHLIAPIDGVVKLFQPKHIMMDRGKEERAVVFLCHTLGLQIVAVCLLIVEISTTIQNAQPM